MSEEENPMICISRNNYKRELGDRWLSGFASGFCLLAFGLFVTWLVW